MIGTDFVFNNCNKKKTISFTVYTGQGCDPTQVAQVLSFTVLCDKAECDGEC